MSTCCCCFATRKKQKIFGVTILTTQGCAKELVEMTNFLIETQHEGVLSWIKKLEYDSAREFCVICTKKFSSNKKLERNVIYGILRAGENSLDYFSIHIPDFDGYHNLGMYVHKKYIPKDQQIPEFRSGCGYDYRP